MATGSNHWDLVEESERPRVAKRYGWSAAPRFDLVKIAMDPSRVEDASLLSPRPVDLLRTLRLVSKNRFTARDHALLDVMLSAVYEDGRLQEHSIRWKRLAGLGEGQHAIPLTFVRHVLGRGSRIPQRDLEQSVARVAAASFSVPAPYEPRRRASPKRAAETQIRAILNLPTLDLEKGPAFAPLPGSREAEEHLQMLAGDEAARREDLRRQGIPTKGRTLVPSVPITKRPPKLGPSLASLPTIQDAAEPKNVVSFARLGMVGDYLVFETSPWLRDVLRSERLVRGRRIGFVHLDLSVLAAFRSPYTANLFRLVLADSYDPRLGRRVWDRTWTWTISISELASTVGYTRQVGGWRAQVLRNVVRPALADLSRSSGSLGIELVDGGGDKPDAPFVFRLHLRLPDDLSRIAPVDDPMPRAVADFLLPSDHPAWSPGMQAMQKAQAIAKIDELAILTKAWRIAVDEVHNEGRGYYGNVTGKVESRRYRGSLLREAVATEGLQRTVALFALEEADDPDLTLHEVQDRVQVEGTWDAIQTDQRLRWGASLHGIRPQKVLRTRLNVGVDAKCAELAQARAALNADRNAKASRDRREIIARANQRYEECIKLADKQMNGEKIHASEAAAAAERERSFREQLDFLEKYADKLGLNIEEDGVDDFEQALDDMYAAGLNIDAANRS